MIPPEPVQALLRRRLVLVTGKGGVGKSTVSAALAVAAQKLGHRVLLVELGARPLMGQLLDGARPQHDATVVAPGRYASLSVTHLNASKALQEYLFEALRVRSLARLATENRVLARLWQAAPSVDEMALLTALQRFEQARDPKDDRRPQYDLVIVDLPATGHAKSMLTVPSGALAMIRVGSLAERAREVEALLRDNEKTAVVIVTLPEELPANEAVELSNVLEEDLGIETAAVLINSVLPRVYEPHERAMIAELVKSVEQPSAQRLLEVATFMSDRQDAQHAQISRLREQLDTEVVEIPFAPESGNARIERLASWFAGSPT